MIQSTSILDPNNWISFLTQIHFFSKTSFDFFKIHIKIFGSRFKFSPNIWIKFKIQNPFFIKEIKIEFSKTCVLKADMTQFVQVIGHDSSES